VTVAAVILADSPETALVDVEGVPNARRLVDTAWAGGATPIVIVAADPAGAIAAVLAGSPAVLAEPGPDGAGSIARMCRGFDAARAVTATIDAALLWPARLGWVDAETVTSLIEAHGIARSAVLRPVHLGTAGWPVLVPAAQVEALRSLDPGLEPDAAIAALVATAEGREIDVGDPGVAHDLGTPRDALPPFAGPPEPPAGHRHEWGAPAAAGPDEPPDPVTTIT